MIGRKEMLEYADYVYNTLHDVPDIYFKVEVYGIGYRVVVKKERKEMLNFNSFEREDDIKQKIWLLMNRQKGISQMRSLN